ncbi:MAG TPA: phosphotransferase family protein [Acidimicrobiaceae bacterium]|nr:phosphotransferase family protein [Acidimicrobiaceae bacterium]
MSGSSPDGAAAGTTRPRTSTRPRQELGRRLEAWLGRRLSGARLSGLEVPESNGMSSETVLFDLSWRDQAGEHQKGCAARLSPDPEAAPVFPVYDLSKQFRVMRLVAERSPVPVPDTLWDEPDPAPVGTPFFVMERVEGDVPPDVMPYPFGSWLSEAAPTDQRRLQDAAVRTLAAIHDAEVSADDVSFLELDERGDSALRRHVAHSASYYEWVVSDGARSPLIERAFAWLEEHWPAHEGGTRISWGDARIGNMMFRHFEPVAVLDWEMAATGPVEIDLGWMVYLHRFLDDIAVEAGLPGMPAFMRRDDVADTYEKARGRAPRDLDFYCLYAALRHAVVMSRVARRQVLFGEISMPEDPDDMIMHRASLEQMLEGSYWRRF